MVFWLRRMYGFVLCRSSDFGGVWLFRMHCRGAAFSASPGSAAPCFLSMYWGSFLLLRWFQRCRFGPAAGTVFLLCLSSDLSGVWLFRMRCRGAAFSASPGSAAPCVLSIYWGSFLLLRGFQRCRSGPAAGTVFLLCLSSDLSGVWLFRMRCRGAAFSASPGSAAPCFLSMYWGSFLLLRGFQRCRSGPAAGTFFLLRLSSDLSGVWLFRMRCRGAAFSASPGSAAPCFLSMYWGSGALFFLGGSKGAVLDPPQVLFFAVPELGFKWCLAVSHALPRSCVFGFSRLGCAMFFVYVLGLFSSS